MSMKNGKALGSFVVHMIKSKERERELEERAAELEEKKRQLAYARLNKK